MAPSRGRKAAGHKSGGPRYLLLHSGLLRWLDPSYTRGCCRGRDAGYPAPPAQIRTSGATAYGSYRGYWRRSANRDEEDYSLVAVSRTRCKPTDAFPQLCIWDAAVCPVFSLVGRLPSMPSAGETLPPWFGHFAGVGSEEARLRAGLRPPLKLHGRFSRMQLSRRLLPRRCNRRY